MIVYKQQPRKCVLYSKLYSCRKDKNFSHPELFIFGIYFSYFIVYIVNEYKMKFMFYDRHYFYTFFGINTYILVARFVSQGLIRKRETAIMLELKYIMNCWKTTWSNFKANRSCWGI